MNKERINLIEVTVVLAILAIILIIAIPRFAGYIALAKERVCFSNCDAIERAYEVYLIAEKLEHTDILFNEYLSENYDDPCPDEGVLSYVDGEVHCFVHVPVEESDKEEEVPFL